MFKNNLKIAWRSLLKDRQFTLLNIIGLSTGLACALLIYLWVFDELRIDRFNKKDSRLYQVMQNIPLGDSSILTSEATPGLLARTLIEEMPEVENPDRKISKFPRSPVKGRFGRAFGPGPGTEV